LALASWPFKGPALVVDGPRVSVREVILVEAFIWFGVLVAFVLLVRAIRQASPVGTDAARRFPARASSDSEAAQP
jgi:hypothetical protein